MHHSKCFAHYRTAAVMLAAVGITGCGSSGKDTPVPVYPATGTITYNGEPLADAMIIFKPVGQQIPRPPFASSNDSGAFTLSTFGINDGAPEGNYQVSVTKFSDDSEEDPVASDENEDDYQPPGFDGVEVDEGPQSLIPERYIDAEKSELTAKISAEGENTITLELVD